MLAISPERDIREVPIDIQEFQTFYQQNLGSIYRYMYSKVGNREVAEDLTSQVFLKVVSSIDYQRSRYSRAGTAHPASIA